MTTSNNNGSFCEPRHRATAVSHFVVKQLTVLALVAFATLVITTPAAWSLCSWDLLWTFNGEAAGDCFGVSVSGAGDVNNDTYADLIVGAYYNDGGGTDAGRAYVYSGQTGTLLWTFTGEASGDYFGCSVSGAGDVNNDGYDDLIVGARYAGGNGKAYVYSGQTGTLLWSFTGEAASDQFGKSVSGAGDVNNDGNDDFIVGAYGNDAGGTNAGRAYVYSGQTGSLLWTFTAEAAGDLFGCSVSGAGDVNNDGYAELIVGAYNNDAGGSDAGRAYVYSGQTGALLWTFTGEAAGDNFGYSVSGAGDVNNDGYDDLIMGAPYNVAAGRAYVYSGQTGALLWTLTGEAAGDNFGYSVSGAADVNNDGYDDLIVGAYGNDAGGTAAGRAYVYSGQTRIKLWTLTGEAASDWFGISVSGAGDVNNDGINDLIVGAHGNDVGGANAGRAYVYTGQTETMLRTLTGEEFYDEFGISVSGAGDVNNDGYADVIVGAHKNDAGGSNAGRAYVYSGWTETLLWTLTGEAANDWFGYSVSGVGDVNNDGYDDLIVGAPNNGAGGSEAGRAYVYSGQTGALLWTFTGEAADNYFGHSVSGAGDVNSDDYADLIVGAPCDYYGGTDTGRAYVYSGQTGTLLWTFTGEASGDYFGKSVSGAGDVNNDGYDDFIVGAYGNDAGGAAAGRAYVYSGQTGALLWTLTGEAAGDCFGYSVSGAGDVNNDGYDDLIVGAYYNDAGGINAGRAYVYSGQTGDTLVIFTGEAALDYFGCSVSRAGDVNNDGYTDLIVGATGNDAAGSEAGRAYVYSGYTGALCVTGEAASNNFGRSVSGAGDVNNDGYDDLIMGAHLNDAGGTDAGRAYVYSIVKYWQNYPPIVTSLDGSEFFCGPDTLRFLVTATDPNSDDTLTLSGPGIPTPIEGASPLSADVEIYISSAGTENYIYKVSDLRGATDRDTAIWVITMNSPPNVIAPDSSKYYCEPDTVEFTVTATDADPGDTLSLSGPGIPTPITGVSPLSTNVKIYLDSGGTHDYIYTVSDTCGATHEDTATWVITMDSPPDSFSLLSPPDSSFVPPVVTFDWGIATDPDSWDTVRYDLHVSASPIFHPDSTVIYDSLLTGPYTDTLDPGIFYWKVRAYDKCVETWSNQAWSFTAFLRGDATGDGLIDVGDVVYLINYLFKSGPAPNPLLAGDANCDSTVEVGDVVYVINYLFKSGPPPPC